MLDRSVRYSVWMWFALAIAASLLWGLTYAIHEQVYRHVSVLMALTISSFLATLTLGAWLIYSGTLTKDIEAISSSRTVFWLLVAEAVASLLAAVLIGLSIQNRDATVAGLIEMSYPFFIVLFTYLLFRENHLNIGTALGGLLIFCGVGIIFVYNR